MPCCVKNLGRGAFQRDSGPPAPPPFPLWARATRTLPAVESLPRSVFGATLAAAGPSLRPTLQSQLVRLRRELHHLRLMSPKVIEREVSRAAHVCGFCAGTPGHSGALGVSRHGGNPRPYAPQWTCVSQSPARGRTPKSLGPGSTGRRHYCSAAPFPGLGVTYRVTCEIAGRPVEVRTRCRDARRASPR